MFVVMIVKWSLTGIITKWFLFVWKDHGIVLNILLTLAPNVGKTAGISSIGKDAQIITQ